MSRVSIVPACHTDWTWIASVVEDIGGVQVVSAGRLHDLRDHPTLIAWMAGHPAGLVTVREKPRAHEVLAIKATEQRIGVGTALLAEAERRAMAAGVAKIWLSTTNDNTDALRFYQKRGYSVSAYHIGGFQHVIRLKDLDPGRQYLGNNGIEIRDMIELTKSLNRVNA